MRSIGVRGCGTLVSLFVLAACSSDEAAPPAGPRVDVSAAIETIANSRETDSERIRAAFDRMRKHSDAETLPLLIAELDAGQATRRRAAIYTLQMMAWDDASQALAPLRKLLTHSEGLTRGAASNALASLGDKPSYDAMIAMLRSDYDPYARRCAAWSIGELGEARGIEDLKALPEDADPRVQLSIESALPRLTFLGEYAAAAPAELAAARAVFAIAGSTPDQFERLERAMTSLRAVDPAVSGKLLAMWKAMGNRPGIQSAAKYAIEKLKTP